MYGRGDYPPYWGHPSNGHPFAWLLAFLIFALIVGVVAAFIIRWLAGRRAAAVTGIPAAPGSAADALAVVRMRYARGEIDREQFLQTSADLGGGSPSGYPYVQPPPEAPTAA